MTLAEAERKARKRAREKAWAKANPERVRAMARRWRAKNVERARRRSNACVARKQVTQPEVLRLQRKGRRLKHYYGMTLGDYNAMLSAQGGGCAICHKACLSGRFLAVDHNHKSGRVRALLCGKCNMALGNLNDSAEKALAAAAYLAWWDERELEVDLKPLAADVIRAAESMVEAVPADA